MYRKRGAQAKGSLRKTSLELIEGTERYRCPVPTAYGLRANDAYMGLTRTRRPQLVNDLAGHASRVQVRLPDSLIRALVG